MDREAAVRAAFAQQAGYCAALAAPFTALLCTLAGARLDRSTRIGRRLLDWDGNPDPFGDAVALRLCGGLHYLARNGGAPGLAPFYPPAPLPDADALWAAIVPLLDDDALALWLDGPPQTNEVRRSAVLMSGLLVIAARFGLPLRLYELGASAGLNLQLDRYLYDLGGLKTGDPAASFTLKPDWQGPPPPSAEIRIAGRAGVDLNPVKLPEGRERLIAYVWADQAQRLAQLEAALAIAAADPPRVEAGDAADWLETNLPLAPEPGLCRVVLHSVAFHYFPDAVKARVTAQIEAAGTQATREAPLAWLRYEEQPGDGHFSLRLRTWPDGGDELLAWVHPHGRTVKWVSKV
ncbi:MAG: DUF2332 family protein [Sphingomonadaceae bacterium]|nr:DUF2332 family protein [Sphingomonadaceae bacterium]